MCIKLTSIFFNFVQQSTTSSAPTATGQSQASSSAAQPQQQQQPAQSGQQQEEFSDMLRMLDNSGTEFTDLSGMFNTFTE